MSSSAARTVCRGPAVEAVDPHAPGAAGADQFQLGADDQEQAERVGDRRAVGDVADQRGDVADLGRAEPPRHRVDLGQSLPGERLELRPGHVGADREHIPIAADPRTARPRRRGSGGPPARRPACSAGRPARSPPETMTAPGCRALNATASSRRAGRKKDPPAGLDPERLRSRAASSSCIAGDGYRLRQPPMPSPSRPPARPRGSAHSRCIGRGCRPGPSAARRRPRRRRTRAGPPSRRRTPACRTRTASRDDRSSPAGSGSGRRAASGPRSSRRGCRRADRAAGCRRPTAGSGSSPPSGTPTRTVQAPQSPSAQPTLVPRSPHPLAEELDEGREGSRPRGSRSASHSDREPRGPTYEIGEGRLRLPA